MPGCGNCTFVPYAKYSFKESGSLENDAICAWAATVRWTTTRPLGRDELLLLKNRRGPTGYVPVKLDSEWLRFEERRVGIAGNPDLAYSLAA